MKSSYILVIATVVLAIQNAACDSADDHAPATARKREVGESVPMPSPNPKRIDGSSVKNYVERLPEVVEEPTLEEENTVTHGYMQAVRLQLLAAQTVYLYSLDGESFPVVAVETPPQYRTKDWEPPDRRPRFHEYSIIRRVRVRDVQSRRQLINGLYGALASVNGYSFCFRPSYGLRIATGGRTMDLLLARDCDRYAVYVNGVRLNGLMCDLRVEPFEAALKRGR
jgi:hypothetical protein